jgi:hypothetical protein
VKNIGGNLGIIPHAAIEILILHNGVWTKNPVTMCLGDQTPLLIRTDEYQGIYTKETYPGGWVDTKWWGWYNRGSYMYRFIADTVGTHRIVADGTVTGSSNVLSINVIYCPGPTPPGPTPPGPTPPGPTPPGPTPPGPTPPGPTTFTVTAWAGSTYYTIGSQSQIYYYVSKPCTARVTYLKQGSGVVVSGPRYVSAGTHWDTGTIGYPRGMRTVVVDAWTSSGEYAYDVTSYNVG